MTFHVTLEQTHSAHASLIAHFGGLPGVRDETRIAAAIDAPRQTFAGEDLYPTIVDKAAALGYLLVSGHGYNDGNKRIGAHIKEVFLVANGYELTATQDEIVDVIFAIASTEPRLRVVTP